MPQNTITNANVVQLTAGLSDAARYSDQMFSGEIVALEGSTFHESFPKLKVNATSTFKELKEAMIEDKTKIISNTDSEWTKKNSARDFS